jgi:hypothetical protein
MAAEEPIKVTPEGFAAYKKKWLSKGSNSSKVFDATKNKELFDAYVIEVTGQNSDALEAKAELPLTPQEEKNQDTEMVGTYEAAQPGANLVDKTQYRARTVNISPANAAAGAVIKGANRTQDGRGEYSGSNLVDESRDVANRGVYDLSPSGGDAAAVYWEIANGDKTGGAINEFLATLKNYKYYGDGKPSDLANSRGGFEAKDINAIAGFLELSNNNMLTWKAQLAQTKKVPPGPSSGSGTAPSYSSREDMASYLRSAAFKNLGRALTQQEMDTAIKNIRAGQVAASGAGGVTAATLTSSSEAAVQTAAPGEAAAYGLGAALDILFKKHGAK